MSLASQRYGAFILRAHRPWPSHLVHGAPIHVTSIDTLRAKDLRSALSLGPSTADAAAGRTQFWDQSLGTSPFRPTARYSRTLLALHDNKLPLQVLDGAPLTSTFQGTTPQETADLCTEAGSTPPRSSISTAARPPKSRTPENTKTLMSSAVCTTSSGPPLTTPRSAGAASTAACYAAPW